MRPYLIAVFVAVSAVTNPILGSEKDTRRAALEELSQLGFQYSAREFVRSCREGSLQAAKLFFQSGMSVNATDEGEPESFGDTCLTTAAFDGHTRIVALLLATRPEVVDQRNAEGQTALMYASQRGHADIVNLLLDAGADPNAVSAKSGTPALLRAATLGYTDIVRVLIKAGADVNHKLEDGTTALHNACFNGEVEIVKLLVTAGADVNGKVKHPLGEMTALKLTELSEFLRPEAARQIKQILTNAGAK